MGRMFGVAMGFARTGGALAAVVLLAACGSDRFAARPGGDLVADPPSFVYVTSAGHGLASRVELRSAATGRLVKRLATFGESFTNNGLAISPDRAHVYVTLIRHPSLRIERIDVADGTRTAVAAGEQPEVSPDGRRLAYIADRGHRSQIIAVRDLASGRTRTIRVGRLVGRGAILFNGSLTWLGDGSDVVAMPGPVPIAAARAPADAGGGGTCASATCLIVVHVTARTLTAHRVVLSRAPDVGTLLAGDDARPDSLLLAGFTGRMTVDRVALRGSRGHVVRLLSRADTLPVAFSPSGARLLYLVGHSPPALWVAGVERGRLPHPHRLMRDARLGAAAW